MKWNNYIYSAILCVDAPKSLKLSAESEVELEVDKNVQHGFILWNIYSCHNEPGFEPGIWMKSRSPRRQKDIRDG